jgi:hypothetical protein
MPPEHEARSRAFYDHEEDEPRGGRRRRAVADWGVSEDVFDRMPSRRFSRRGEASRAEAPRDATRRDEPREDARREEPRETAGRDEPRFARGDESYDRPVSRTIVIEREPDIEPEIRDEEPDVRATSADGRRTIVIAGRPDRMPVPRSRPSRTALDRIGHRPDRIVAYAVALGFLLILIAILTSS